MIKKTICWYLRRCGGAFHCYPYGPDGRYVVLMNEQQFHRYMAAASGEKVGKQVMGYLKLMRSIDADEESRGCLK